MVKKANGKWRMCVEFTNLNKACPKDSYPLPSINSLVDNASRCHLLSFLDAFSEYKQICMYPKDESKTTFTIEVASYWYKVIPFDLKNAGATYQRHMDQILSPMLGHNVQANPDKCTTIIEMRSPANVKEVQQLTGCMATLSYFLLASGDKGYPYFQCLKKNNRFAWTDECEKTFVKLK